MTMGEQSVSAIIPNRRSGVSGRSAPPTMAGAAADSCSLSCSDLQAAAAIAPSVAAPASSDRRPKRGLGPCWFESILGRLFLTGGAEAWPSVVTPWFGVMFSECEGDVDLSDVVALIGHRRVQRLHECSAR